MTNTDSEYKRTCTCTGKVHWRDTTCHQSEKPQPENWEIEFDKILREDHEWKCQAYAEHLTCCIDEDGEKYIPIKSFIRSLLSRQKEQMLELLRGIRGRPPLCDRCAHHVCEYQAALSDVEEKIKAL